MMSQRILITNDDGIHAPGIDVLERIARTLSDDVWIVAPEVDQSGKSHSLSITEPLRIRAISPKKYAVRGTPADCVVVACRHLMKDEVPALILSGVNRGANLAEDMAYSGTVAAALEGTFQQIRSIALAQDLVKGSEVKWHTVERHGPPLLRELIQWDLPRGVFLNVNFPNVDPDEIRGAVVTKLGERSHFSIEVQNQNDARGFPYLWMRFNNTVGDPAKESDLYAMQQGCISVTPLHFNFNHPASVEVLGRTLSRSTVFTDHGKSNRSE